MKEVVIVSAVRTPVGRYGGALSSVDPVELGTLVVKENIERINLDTKLIDEVIFSNLMAYDTNNMARVISLNSNIPIEVPAFSIDRQCGSSIDAIAIAAMKIQLGVAKVIVAGGVESDSRRPYIIRKMEKGFTFPTPEFVKDLMFSPPHIGNPNMGVTAENLAKEYNITRENMDEYSIKSHKKAAIAWDKGYFDEQIIPVKLVDRKGNVNIVKKDEVLRKNINMKDMSKLKPAFIKDGLVTAGNSSPMSDGAGALILMERELAESLGLEILGKYVMSTSVGVDPNIMGIGAAKAINKLVTNNGLNLDEIDLIEMNEAFASQSIACIKDMKLDKEKLNVNGGAIALGHPLAGTGAILATKLLYELKRRNNKKGLISFCCGGGQGVAMVLERI
ncbi:thiolase family protein [Senegalia massiliensis]|uniref:Acetyl-CoA acetyltransferase n=1 Tax=Senegalia massiliensis TaxID=1720316 RepID=A0A845QUH3_9CLOT|nr:thiolase family protein [Senegalia massiliensis]NBI06175.1 thiolase family protein [Senegalia massiliensis]